MVRIEDFAAGHKLIIRIADNIHKILSFDSYSH